MAGAEAAGGGFGQRWAFGAAEVSGVGAAGVEGAAGGAVGGVGDVAGEDDAFAGSRVGAVVDLGDGGEQGLGVGVGGGCVQRFRVGELDDLAEVHDGDAVGDVPYDAEVVGDEDVREPELVLEVGEEVEHLGLDGDVEGGDGFVGDDQSGAGREGSGDADALALPAGELVGVAVEVGGGQAHDLEELGDAVAYRACAALPVDLERLGDDVAGASAGVQGGVGILEDQLEPGAYGAQPPGAEGGDVLAVELDAAAGDVGEPDEAAAEGGLAAAGLADDAEGLPGADVEETPLTAWTAPARPAG